jgi:hypothetical protein
VAQIRAGGDRVPNERQSLSRGDENPHIAVAQDIGDLICFEKRVDRNEHPPRGSRPEAGDHGLETLVEKDTHAVGPLQFKRKEPGCERLHADRQLSVLE